MPNSITYTVTTVAGSRQHTVEGEADNLVATALIRRAYSGRRPGFYLPNPPTFYTLSNVVSVSFEGSIPVVHKEVERKMGFAPKDEDESS